MLFCHLHYADITLNSNTGPSIPLVCVVYGCALYLKHTVAFIIKQIVGRSAWWHLLSTIIELACMRYLLVNDIVIADIT